MCVGVCVCARLVLVGAAFPKKFIIPESASSRAGHGAGARAARGGRHERYMAARLLLLHSCMCVPVCARAPLRRRFKPKQRSNKSQRLLAKPQHAHTPLYPPTSQAAAARLCALAIALEMINIHRINRGRVRKSDTRGPLSLSAFLRQSVKVIFKQRV